MPRECPVRHSAVPAFIIAVLLVAVISADASAQESTTRGRRVSNAPAAEATLTDDDAWRLLFNASSIADARSRVRIDGDDTLALPLLRARSVIV